MIISEEKLDKPGNLDKSINSGSSWKDQETLHVQNFILLVSHILQLILQGFRVNNRVDWKFPGYLISGRLLINGRDWKSKNYVFIANVKKRI